MSKSKKQAIISGAIGILIVLSMVIFQKSRLTYDEERALECVQDLHDMMRDENSFKLEDDILLINYVDKTIDLKEELYCFSYISYSGNNGLSGKTKGLAIYNRNEYLGDYTDEKKDIVGIEDEEEKEREFTLLQAKSALSKYNSGKLKDKDSSIVKKNRIENRVK